MMPGGSGETPIARERDGRFISSPRCHCERSEAISGQLSTTMEIAASLRSSQ
jgi:hypothetical protein